jgi:EAL domain-containing protein (putative c-di-GMP-specific phosphodiesterase class I)
VVIETLLKIDRSFVNQIEDTKDNLGIIRAIINLAHDLGMTVTTNIIQGN